MVFVGCGVPVYSLREYLPPDDRVAARRRGEGGRQGTEVGHQVFLSRALARVSGLRSDPGGLFPLKQRIQVLVLRRNKAS